MLATNPAVDASTGRTPAPVSSRPTPKWVTALAPPLIAYRQSRLRSGRRRLSVVGMLGPHQLFGHRRGGRLRRLLLHQVAGPAADLLVDPGQVFTDHAQPEQDERPH